METSSGPPPNESKAPTPPAKATPQKHGLRQLATGAAALVAVLLLVLWAIFPSNVVSTDDAYVNGRVTFVAARVPGQIARVLVDDNNRVRKGDLLVQLDKEPYQTQVDIAQAALDAAKSEVVVVHAQTRGIEAQMRSLRFALEHAIEDVDNQVALLRSKVATLASKRATFNKAKTDVERMTALAAANAASKEEVDRYQEVLLVAQAEAEEALQGVYQVRAGLGLKVMPDDAELANVPPDINQTSSSVRQAMATLVQAAAQVGVVDSFNKTPRELVETFYKRDPSGDIDKIYERILKDAPRVKQAESQLVQAERELDHAKLNMKYCDVIAEIDGVVTRREANPGNNVQAGQSLMAVRSLTEVWVDANFKETQLSKLRIGQPVDLKVDMYGRRRVFKGRVSGFTMGTGSTLALLPPENATGNFVKVVQRLPVRIDLIDYKPDEVPLFVGLSVTPSVHVNEKTGGDHAGMVLQPYQPMDRPTDKPLDKPTENSKSPGK